MVQGLGAGKGGAGDSPECRHEGFRDQGTIPGLVAAAFPTALSVVDLLWGPGGPLCVVVGTPGVLVGVVVGCIRADILFLERRQPAPKVLKALNHHDICTYLGVSGQTKVKHPRGPPLAPHPDSWCLRF